MYYPKSQIQTGFYSNNELVIADSNELYIGPYFKVSNGELFTGKEPNDGPNKLLLDPTNGIDPINNNIVSSNLLEDQAAPDPRFTPDNITYTILSGQQKTPPPYTPTPYYPIITESNISNGEFTRFFVKKSNENIYTEISPQNSILALNSPYYLTFQFQWVISGNKEEVKQINAKQIAFVEKNLDIIGLVKFLKFNYLQFYQG